MRSKGRRSVAVGAGLLGTGLAVYGAHKATQRALRTLAGPLTVVELPVEPVEVYFEELLGGDDPLPSPDQPAGPGQQMGWDGALGHLSEVYNALGPIAGKFGDAIDYANTFIWHALPAFAYDTAGDVLAAFDTYFGIAGSWFDYFLQGAIDTFANILGLATAGALNAMIAATSSALHHLNEATNALHAELQSLAPQAITLTNLAISFARQSDQLVLRAAYGLVAGLRTELLTMISDVQTQVLNVTNYINNVPTLIINLVEQQLPLSIPDIATQVEQLLEQNLQTLVQVTVDASVALALVDVIAEIATITQTLTDEQACCDANSARGQNLDDRLKALEDLLNGLGSLLGVLTMAELLQLIKDFLAGEGGDVGGLVAGWLDGSVSPADLIASAF